MQQTETDIQVMDASLSDRPACDIFVMDGRYIIQEEKHFGVMNGKLTTGVAHQHVMDIKGMWAPPYVSSNFYLEGRVFGEKVPTASYTWQPHKVVCSGQLRDVSVSSDWTLIYGHRAGVLTVRVENNAKVPAPLDFMALAWLNREKIWHFSTNLSPPECETIPEVKSDHLLLRRDDLAIVIASDNSDVEWNISGNLASVNLVVPAGETVSFSLVVSIGTVEEAEESCCQIVDDPLASVQASDREYYDRVTEIFERVPRLVSSNKKLVDLYNRSLFPFLLNRWEVPEFVISPYYSTGGINGGCVGGYLYDFAESWGILPLYEPAAVRDHIKQFLKIDLTQHYLFDPLTGEAGGPWYMINQEKIIGLTYRYVAATGDVGFLDEIVNDKTILEHMIINAMFGDSLDKPISLIDYGTSNSHLELRRQYQYNHIMSDLNGRRYQNYLHTSQLCDVAGKPAPYLRERAEMLKELLVEKLWDNDTKWFSSITESGEKYTRYTIQMFKLFGSGVLDKEAEEGLLSHMNEDEFLSPYGLHSISKKDLAFDQLDIDNGGGGICIGFPAQIIEKLCRAGYPAEAADILERILWWPDLMPYWGDSIAANCKDYRRDTPLQNSLEGAAIAQCIIFGIFGIDARPDGSVTIKPNSLPFASNLELTGVKIAGTEFSIAIDEDTFTVSCEDQVIKRRLGESVQLDTSKKLLFQV